jgi:branched-chain amino acid transport system substrate-binding protein
MNAQKFFCIFFCISLLYTFLLFSFPTFAEAKIRVGFLGAFSGTDPNTSNELFRGAQIYLKLNKLADQALELEKIDTLGQIQGASSALGEATKKGIKLFVGIANSDEAVAAAKFADEHDILFITPFATNEKVTSGRKNTFRACFNDKQQGEALARFAKNMATGSRIAVLTNEMSSYSIGLSEIFMAKFEPSSVLESDPNLPITLQVYHPNRFAAVPQRFQDLTALTRQYLS